MQKTILVLAFALLLSVCLQAQNSTPKDLSGTWFLNSGTDTLNFERQRADSTFTEWRFNKDTVSIGSGYVITIQSKNGEYHQAVILKELAYYQWTLLPEGPAKDPVLELTGKDDSLHFELLFVDPKRMKLRRK